MYRHKCTSRFCLLSLVIASLIFPAFVSAADLPIVSNVAAQPLASQAKRVEQALQFLADSASPVARVLETAMHASARADLGEESGG